MDIGEKIKRLRMQNHLTQEDLANRAELSKGFISQLERNITSPSIATLTDILQCLGTDLKSFFNDSTDTQIVFKQDDYFENETADYTVKWIVPNAQKNMMEPLLLSLSPEGSTLPDLPHEGEEFGFVLKGNIVINLGHKQHKARAGESFYYIADCEHFLSNPYKKEAHVLWISSPPNF